MPMDKNLLHQLGATPSDVVLFNIEGDSMEPKFKNGDLIYVDTGAVNRGFKDGVWFFRFERAYLVKQLQMVGAGQLQAVSANPAYQPMVIKESDDYELIGRVIYQGLRV